MTEVDGPLSMREQQRAFTRRRLMEVAQQLFAAQGYPDTTVDDIARAAGASRATFYLHFKSKAELMGSAIDAMVPMAVETYHVLDEQLADDGPQLPSRLRGWLAEWLERWTDGAQASHATLQATMLEPEVEMHYLKVFAADHPGNEGPDRADGHVPESPSRPRSRKIRPPEGRIFRDRRGDGG